MPWFNVDDGFYDHPKVDDLPLEAVGLWTLAGAYCMRQLTDGAITESRARKFGGTPESIDPLLESGLWTRTEDGYQFKDWGDWQLTRAQIEERREKERIRKQKQRRDSEGKYAGTPQNVPPTVPAGHPRDSPQDSAKSHTVQSNPIQSPTTHAQAQESAHRSASASFDQWWPHWKKKKSKGDAAKAFKTAIKKIPLPDLIAKTDAYWTHIDATGTDHQFVPYPGKWLRAEAWDDDLTTPQQQPTAFDPRKDW